MEDKNNNNFVEVPMEWSEFPIQSLDAVPYHPRDEKVVPGQVTEERYNQVLMQEKILSGELELLNAKLCKLQYRNLRLEDYLNCVKTRADFKVAELRSLTLRFEFLLKKAIALNTPNVSNCLNLTPNEKTGCMKSTNVGVSAARGCGQLKASINNHQLKAEHRGILSMMCFIETELRKLGISRK